MKRILSPARRHARLFAIVAIVAGLACATPALAEAPPFAGRWLLDAAGAAPSAPAPYTTLEIKGGTLTWRGAAPSAHKCSQAYALTPEPRGTQYTNARGTKFIAGIPGSLPTYLLTLGAGDCGSASGSGGNGSGADAIRIIYPLVYDTRHIEVIDYVKGRAVAARRFQRRK